MPKKYIFVLVIFVFLGWLFWGNSSIEVNRYTVSSDKLSNLYDGFVIAHVSDFHNAQSQSKQLLSLLKDSNPSIIVITGDLIDSRSTKVDVALDFVEEAVKIAPCYYVNGNHESRVKEYIELKDGLVELGVVVLEDEIVSLDESFSIIGLVDPDFAVENRDEILSSLVDVSSFNVLLSHRPEIFSLYVKNEVDVVFSGHAHGGQARLPFIGGLIAPHQGFFPTYDSGLYEENSTKMLVSRGIGNSIIPMRFNNRPNLILVELQSE